MQEFLSVELGSIFEGTNIRQMAIDIEMKDLYDLVYSPSSSELHGEWTTLKDYNLVICANPLHRFHRLPNLTRDRFLAPGIVLTASSMLSETIQAWLENYKLAEEFGGGLRSFQDSVNEVFTVSQGQ